MIEKDDDALPRLTRKLFSCFVLLALVSVIGVSVWRAYTGPYWEKYEARALRVAHAKQFLAFDACRLENRALTQSINECANYERLAGQYIWLGAFREVLDEARPFDLFLGKDSTGLGGLLSADVIFRLAGISVILIAALWLLSLCGVLAQGYKVGQDQYSLPSFSGQYGRKEKVV